MVILTNNNHEVDPFSIYTLDNLLFDIHANGLSESEIDNNPFLSTIRDNYPEEVAHAFELERDRMTPTVLLMNNSEHGNWSWTPSGCSLSAFEPINLCKRELCYWIPSILYQIMSNNSENEPETPRYIFIP